VAETPLAITSAEIDEVKIDVSILIVSYNTRDFTLPCLKSVYQQTRGITFEVIVVDNNSDDGSADAIERQFPQVKLIRSEKNLGFAAANNLAAKRAVGEFVLLLNPDTIVLDGAICKLLDFAVRHPQAGIWGGRTVFGDGTLNPNSCWRRPTLWSTFCRGVGLSAIFRRNAIFNAEAYGGWQRNSVRQVDIVTGCFFLIQHDLWRQLGGFDSAFFMYAEEVDLCLRARKAGYRPLLTPHATIIHYGGKSEQVRGDRLVKQWRAKVQLFDKHWSPGAVRFAVTMLLLWVGTRALGWKLLGRRGNPSHENSRAAWAEAWRRRDEWLGRPSDSSAVPLSVESLAKSES
jgi:GT2 family glycosyltransferase